VPVEFLSDEQAAAHGRYAGPPPRVELERYFYLDDADKARIARRRGDHNRLGFALQAVTVRFIGTFLTDPLDAPAEVLDYVAEQLGIADPSCAGRYTEREKTRMEHAWEIQREYGLRDFADAEQELAEWIDARAWTTGDGPKAIFDGAVGWLRDRRVVLPGATTLARLVSCVRAQRLWETLHALLTPEQQAGGYPRQGGRARSAAAQSSGIAGGQRRTEAFTGRWLVPPGEEARSRLTLQTTGYCYGVALTQRGQIAVWRHHPQALREATLEVSASIQDADLPADIRDKASAALGSENITWRDI
jgi:hypothetical protein